MREVRSEVPWYGTLYNHCSAAIPAIAAGFTYELVADAGKPPQDFASLVALLAGAGCYVAINETLAAIAIGIRTGRSWIVVLSSDLRAYGLSLAGLAPLSWLMALAYVTVGPMVVLLFALPLYTTRASYQGVVEIRKMFTQTVRALASAIDARDESTMRHSDNVSSIAVEIGQVMGVGEAALEQLEWGGLLHDIGKIGVPDAVLLKAGRLDRAERVTMNKHPEMGAEILSGVEKLGPELPLIRHHHEWWNGSGYPDRLVGEEIPFLARVLHVADAYEAMTASRPYRPRPLSPAQALGELRKYSGIQFDPRVVDAFLRTRTGVAAIADQGDTPLLADIPSLAQLAAMRTVESEHAALASAQATASSSAR